MLKALLIGAAVAAVLLSAGLLYCCLVAAGRADRADERRRHADAAHRR